MAVAKGYRDRHLPADVLVVDWFYYTKMGQMDLDPEVLARSKGDEQAASRHGLRDHDQRVAALCAGGPLLCRTAPEGLVHPLGRRHANRRTALRPRRFRHRHHQSRCGRWYWKTIHDNILSKGFDSLWADETEPDLPPNGAYFHVGPGTEYFNVYPLFHTEALYDGFRRDEPGSAR